MRSVAGLHLDPLGELTAVPRPSSWVKGMEKGGEWEREKEREGKGEEEGGERRKGKDPQCVKCVDANECRPAAKR